ALGLVLLAGGCSEVVTTPATPTPASPTPAPAPAGPARSGGVPDPGQQPNILVIETDDMRQDELRWMPRTRALLASGLRFTNSFAPNPLCCPSRASFLTGQYSHHHGVLSHVDPYGFSAFDDSSTLATALQQVGYRTALVGKYLNGYGEQPTRLGEDSLTYVPPGWTQWWAGSDHVWGAADDVQGGTYDYFHLVANVNGSIRGWPGEYSTDVTATQARAVIDGFEEPEPGGTPPWFVWWTPIAPHHGSPVEDDDPGRVERSDGFEVHWVTPARPDGVKGDLDDQVTHGLGTPATGSAEADRSDKPQYLQGLPELSVAEQEAVTEVSRQRAEALTVLDDQVATTLRDLDAADTLVVLTSDNGYYLGEHLKRQGKINLHEPSIRVPLLIAGPGVPPGERFDPITTVDLAQTLAGYAGAILEDPDGLDLRSVIADGDQGWTRPIVLEGLMPEPRYRDAVDASGWPSRLDTVGVRTSRWKLVRYPTGEVELYDLYADPLELDSRGADPALGGVRRELTKLWRDLTGCAGQECHRPLPVDLQASPEQERAAALDQVAQTNAYYR
ncbi:MAG: sulfatase-like hydrolase/transferase, partial [Nocardioides sp.]|nr:sulfatase-like hydrolase/transferase [Nocardioides sp.]